jgi:hypothetical protein
MAVIKQGVDLWIEANSIIDVRTGSAMNVTGYPVHAVARARYQRQVLGRRIYRYRMLEPVIAEWHTTPTGTQGLIVAGGAVTDRVQIHVTPTQTSGWRCPLVIIQAEMTDPITGFVERIIDEVYEVDPETVTT